jgi:hypothetical protein
VDNNFISLPFTSAFFLIEQVAYNIAFYRDLDPIGLRNTALDQGTGPNFIKLFGVYLGA